MLGEVVEGELPAETADAIEDDGGALATVDGDDLALDVVEERAPADEAADDLDVVVDLGNLLGIGDDTVGLVEDIANLEDLLVGDPDEGGGLAVVDVAAGVGDALGDEGTLLHDLHTVGLIDTDEELAMDDDLLLTGRDGEAGLAAHTALDGDVGPSVADWVSTLGAKSLESSFILCVWRLRPERLGISEALMGTWSVVT